MASWAPLRGHLLAEYILGTSSDKGLRYRTRLSTPGFGRDRPREANKSPRRFDG